MVIYVEGGGKSKVLQIECREGFRKFLEKAGFKGKMPGIKPCGPRNNAHKDFGTAISNGESAFLLVDSEDMIHEDHQKGDGDKWKPWAHLGRLDKWTQPKISSDSHCHLMVQCMEAWLIADPQQLKKFFGNDFNENSLPQNNQIERVAKKDLLAGLKKATKACQKGSYSKSDHSFKLLGSIDPSKVTEASPWAKRFIDTLEREVSNLP